MFRDAAATVAGLGVPVIRIDTGILSPHSSTLEPETEKLLRIMKLTEETGEVTQAVTGTLGQNPPQRRHPHLGRRPG
jgi:hypothetical protein